MCSTIMGEKLYMFEIKLHIRARWEAFQLGWCQLNEIDKKKTEYILKQLVKINISFEFIRSEQGN